MTTKTIDTTNSAAPSAAPREAHQRSGFQNQSLTDFFGDPISVYSRAQALEDGMLIDISESAREAGFRCPVAITAAAWSDCVEWDDADSERQTHQDQAGRLWDVVWMAAQAAKRGGMQTLFQLFRVPRGGRGVRAKLTTLKMVAGPGDESELVITIMLQNED